jgi:membrane protease YdiL (CAAX protease family)
VALAGCLVLAVAGLWIGPAVARPFFGTLEFPVPLAALVPAVLFGVANGVLEEVAYRGAMQAWLGRLAPIGVAIGFQALVFGIVHAGPEVTALLPVHVALLTGVGVAAGVIRWRLGSLWVPIGIHVGADVALYVGLACRSPL